MNPPTQPATPPAVDLALALADCEPINDAKSVNAGYALINAGLVRHSETVDIAALRIVSAELRELRAKLADAERERDDANLMLASLADTVASAHRNINPCSSIADGITLGSDLREPIWELSYAANKAKAALAERDADARRLERVRKLRDAWKIASKQGVVASSPCSMMNQMADKLTDVLDDAALASEAQKTPYAPHYPMATTHPK
jgi:hypothetical protein